MIVNSWTFDITDTISAIHISETNNFIYNTYPESKVHGANMGPTWVLSAPDGPHVGPMNRTIRECTE